MADLQQAESRAQQVRQGRLDLFDHLERQHGWACAEIVDATGLCHDLMAPAQVLEGF